MYYHVNGELVPESEATVSVRDRGFMYGDAAFETLRAYGGEIFEWEAHADRLARTAELLSLDHGLARDDLHDRVRETLRENQVDEAYVRLSITRGVQPGKLTPAPDVDPSVVVIVKKLPRGGVDGTATWAGPARVRTTGTRRVPDESIPARAKTHNYLDGILARLELRGTAADEALMLDPDGYVSEGATSNLFFVEDGALRTPSLDGPVLPGVTRRVVVELARSEGIPVEEGTYGPEMLYRADEAFLTNTTWEVRPVESLDEQPIGAGPVTELLSTLFDRLVEHRHYRGEAVDDATGDAPDVG